MSIGIKKADYSGKYSIKLYFSDHTVKVINFRNFLKGSNNPMTQKYLDLKEFRNFTVRYGDLIWGDYELCFPIWDLHEGKI